MKIYNTLIRNKQEFKPINKGKINLFVCGPTVYDYPHLGHAKTYTQFDFIAKYLRYKGYDVFYLQNITDLDDKIIQRAADAHTDWKKLSEAFRVIYVDNMRQLHIDSVTEYAKATDFIPQIVSQVKRLMEKGYAYQISDGIYFEISKFAEYGKLSKRSQLQAEDAVSRIDASVEKRGANDFCLWKFSKPNEPSWETELGKGRPGWHIEDTAITEHYFGAQYDIHGGATDLIFPHHEAEITQMESVSGKSPLVNYWMHTGFLNIHDEKMSKSKGNFLTIDDALLKYDYKTLRYLFISNRYRTQINFDETSLEQAKASVTRINECVYKLDAEQSPEKEHALLEDLKTRVTNHLDDDFDTPQALARIFEYIKARNSDGMAGMLTLEYFKQLNSFFDFISFDTGVVFDTHVLDLIEQREEKRKAGDYDGADKIREELKSQGIEVDDTKGGVRWKKV